MVAKLVIAALKLGIGYPDWETVALSAHASIDVGPQCRRKRIGAGSECSDPEGLLELVCDAINSIPESAIAMRVRLDAPRLLDGGIDDGITIRASGGGTRRFALYACRSTIDDFLRIRGRGRTRDRCIMLDWAAGGGGDGDGGDSGGGGGLQTGKGVGLLVSRGRGCGGCTFGLMGGVTDLDG